MSKPASIPEAQMDDVKGRDVMNLFPLYLNVLIFIFQETTTAAFGDMGKLLLGGTAGAMLLAIGFTLIRLRMRDKKPQTSRFISISAIENEKPAK